MKKKLLITSILVLIVLFAFAPATMRYLALPQGSKSFDDCVLKLTMLAECIRDYKLEHKGQHPETIAQLNTYIMQKDNNKYKLLTSLSSLQYQYSATNATGQPVVIYYATFYGRPIKFWISDKNELYAARMWQWPTWKLSDKHLQTSYK